MTPDPRWLEILKASSWQLFALSGGAGLLLLAPGFNWLPALPPLVGITAFAVFVICGLLAIANAIQAGLKFFPPGKWISHYVRIRREKKWVANYIPSMTDHEREIIGYLLANNQRSFIAAQDGGYAMPLISHRIVVRALQPGQVFDAENTPFVVPDHLWPILQAHEAAFPALDPDSPHPWRIPWQLR